MKLMIALQTQSWQVVVGYAGVITVSKNDFRRLPQSGIWVKHLLVKIVLLSRTLATTILGLDYNIKTVQKNNKHIERHHSDEAVA